ncbi:MAG TPA: hypothetical protein VFH54_15225 [Mycobacteriales bacterium]|nr:hypothetical protein [Mycobacteriales bacterium]
MARTHKDSKRPGGRQRRISVRGVHRDPVDLRKLSRALIALAQAQAEADARAEREGRERSAQSADDEDGHGD